MNQQIYEIERHAHSNERWFELKSSPTSVNVAVRMGTGATSSMPFVIDAGNNTWGSWVQIMGSSDTPSTAGNKNWDFHRVAVSATERQYPYCVQVAWATSGTSAGSAYNEGRFTEFPFCPTGTNGEQAITELWSRRISASQIAWARCICPGQDTGAFSFFYGIHEYYI